MARKIVHQLIDDLDGTVLEPGSGETVDFAVDGVAYQIDLTDEHAAELRDAFQRYISAGRRAGRGAAPAPRRASSPKRGDLSEIRDWAKGQGFRVSDRGRISANVIEAYDAAH